MTILYIFQGRIGSFFYRFGISLLSGLLCLCNNAEILAQQRSSHQLRVEDGLISNTLYTILQSRSGYIWTCGENGISMFNGESFINYSTEEGLPDNEILKLFEDSHGRMWYISLKGYTGYIENEKVYPEQELNQKINDKVAVVKEDWNGNIVFGCMTRGVLQLQNGSLRELGRLQDPKGNSMLNFSVTNDIAIDRVRKKMYGTFGNRILEIKESGGFSTILKQTPEIKDLRLLPFPGAIMALSQEKNREDLGIYTLTQDLKLQLLIPAEKVKSSTFSLLKTRKNEVWVGTANGVLVFKNHAGSYVKTAYHLKTTRISGLLEDQEGNIWASTLGEGVYIFPKSNIRYYETDSKLHDPFVTAVAITENNTVYIGTNHGKLYTLKNDQFLPFGLGMYKEDKLSGYNRVIALKASTGNVLWAACDHNLLWYHEKHSKAYYPEGVIKAITAKPGSELYLGTHCGIMYTEKSSIPQYNKLPPELSNRGRISALLLGKNNELWFSDETGLKKYAQGKVFDISKSSALLKERIVSIVQGENDELWLATKGKGLLRHSPESTKAYTKENGLLSNICNTILPDSNRTLWLATEKGISRINYNTDNDRLNIQNISSQHGLLSDKVTSLAKNGHLLYAGTPLGLCFFDERDIIKNTSAPAVYIRQLKLFEKIIPLRTNYTFQHNENNIRINYVGLNYSSFHNVRFKYKMEGIDKDWVSTTSGEAAYPSLPPGSYTFSVKCINEDGVESLYPASINICIGSPYWETWWFWVLITLLFMAGIIYYTNRRVANIQHLNYLRQQILLEEQKALRAQMDPHFIFNALSSIRSFILKSDIKLADAYLGKFAKLIRRILENSQSPTIPIQDELDTLKAYLEIEALRFDNGLSYHIELDPDIDPYTLEIPSMLIQPYVENSIWHGLLPKKTPGNIWIKVYKNGNTVLFTIEDDGIGRKVTVKGPGSHSSAGMNISENRLLIHASLKQLTASVHIIDLIDADGKPCGTRVEIRFKYPD